MIHDMNDARQRHKQATRELIIQSFLELAHRENALTISIPAVAEEAGVSVRTVYRHFPTKDDLQNEAAKSWGRRVRDESVGKTVTRTNFNAYLSQLWKEFDSNPAAVLAEHTTPVGRDIRRERLEFSRAMTANALSTLVESGVVDDDMVDTVVAVSSSSMYLELVHRMGHDSTKAVAIVSRLLEVLLDHMDAEQAKLEEL